MLLALLLPISLIRFLSMEISVRKHFHSDEGTWKNYFRWIGLPHLNEVRSIDGALNPSVGEPTILYPPDDDISPIVTALPEIDTTQCYYLLAVNLEEDVLPELPSNAILLGYDMTDETRTSSVLNCGPWTDELAPIAQRLNRYGLLTLEDAHLAEQLLPQVWGEEELHAWVDIWALYEIAVSAEK